MSLVADLAIHTALSALVVGLLAFVAIQIHGWRLARRMDAYFQQGAEDCLKGEGPERQETGHQDLPGGRRPGR